MGLSGSDTAYRFGVAKNEPRGSVRADSTRAGFFYRDVVLFTLAGTKRSGVVQSSIRIDLNTGDEPNRCSFDFKGGSSVIPTPGQEITIAHGTTANVLFAGRLTDVTRTIIRNDDKKPTYRCEQPPCVFEAAPERLWSYN